MRGYLMLVSTVLVLVNCRSVQPTASPDAPSVQLITPFKLGILNSYGTAVSIYGKSITGILRFKKVTDGIYRLSFDNESGLSLLTAEITSESMKVHHCIDQLNKKVVLRTLESDFRMLFYDLLCTGWDRPVDDANLAFAKCGNSELQYYFYSQDGDRPERIQSVRKNKPHTTLEFSNFEERLPGSVTIEHHTIKLAMRLERI